MKSASPTTWMPIYWGDYLKDTMHLSAEEHGAYLLLIAHYWSNGGKIKNCKILLKNVCKISSKKLQNVLAFFEEKDGYLVHSRIDVEIQKAKEYKEKSTARAKKAAETRWNSDDASSNAQAMLDECPPPSPSHIPSEDKSSSGIENAPPKKKPYTENFDVFWKAYPKHAGSKSDAAKKYEAAMKLITHAEILTAVKHYADYIGATDTPVAHATTWLNQRRWEVDYQGLTEAERGKNASNSGNKPTSAVEYVRQLEERERMERESARDSQDACGVL